ncbi:MAG: hypothetical protein RR593_08360 [Hungatella sp.]
MEAHEQESCTCPEAQVTCTGVSAYYADLSVPIKIRPYAIVGNLETVCCGDPIISCRTGQGNNGSCGCEITITQTICIRIPVEYGTLADIGDTCISCKKNQVGCNSNYR